MDKIKVKKAKLLTILKENMDKHDEIYEEAVKNYWLSVEQQLDEKVAKIKEKISSKEEVGISIHISLVEPESHREEYEIAIDMLNMSVDDEIELSSYEFKCYVKNDWSWTNSFIQNNAFYSKMSSRENFVK